MIRNFADKESSRIWKGEASRALPPDIQPVARRKLRQLNRIANVGELAIPRGNRLEQLKGKLKGRYSIRINDQWRITFAWSNGGADDVRIEDYHG